jgi:hypothetical protein
VALVVIIAFPLFFPLSLGSSHYTLYLHFIQQFLNMIDIHPSSHTGLSINGRNRETVTHLHYVRYQREGTERGLGSVYVVNLHSISIGSLQFSLELIC